MFNEADENTSIISDIIPVTPDTRITRKPIMNMNHWTCSGALMLNETESAGYMELQNPTSHTVSKSYVYRSFRELFDYNTKRQPTNINLKIIGIYKIGKNKIPYLQGHEAYDQNLSILLNVRLLQTAPRINEVVEIFGQLDFRTVMNNDLPIVVVHFFSPLEGNISDYIYCLMKQRKFVFSNCLQLDEETERADDSLIDLLQNLSMSILSLEE